MKIPSSWKRVSLDNFIFGDFDGDGVPNVDDERPFDASKGRPKFSRVRLVRSQMSDSEVSLAEQLREIRNRNDSHRPLMFRFLRENKGSTARIKSVPSTIKKLREKYSGRISDIAAGRVVTPDRRSALVAKNAFVKRNTVVVGMGNNFYAHPKDGVYYAYHTEMRDVRNKDFKMEVQFKSVGMHRLSERMHPVYKGDRSELKKFRVEGRRLFLSGQ